MKVVLDTGACVPTRAHAADAGLDIKTPVSFTLESGKSIVIDTGVHIQLPPGTVGMLKSKSGLNTKYGIVCEGVIDEGYTGSIRARLCNTGPDTVKFNAGDKITQLVILPVIRPVIEIVDSLEETERGNCGFGSTGR